MHFLSALPLYLDYDGVVNGPDEGINIAKALGDKDFVILQNHGILTTGSMVDTAADFKRRMPVSTNCRICWRANCNPRRSVRHTRDYVANDLSAFASMQPMLDVLWENEPDF